MGEGLWGAWWLNSEPLLSVILSRRSYWLCVNETLSNLRFASQGKDYGTKNSHNLELKRSSSFSLFNFLSWCLWIGLCMESKGMWLGFGLGQLDCMEACVAEWLSGVIWMAHGPDVTI